MNELLIIKTGETLPEIQHSKGDFEQLFANAMPCNGIHLCNAYKNEPLPGAIDHRLAVITGSPAMVTDNSDWILNLEQWVRERLETGLPLLGVCFGHQLIARALGGDCDYNPNGRQIGTIEAFRLESDDLLLTGLGQTFTAQVTHQQSVTRLPEKAVHLCTSPLDDNHAFRVGESVWGVQFHPEFDGWVIEAYLKSRKHDILSEGLNWQALFTSVKPATDAERVLQNFCQMALQPA